VLKTVRSSAFTTDTIRESPIHVILQPEGWPKPVGYANGMRARGRTVSCDPASSVRPLRARRSQSSEAQSGGRSSAEPHAPKKMVAANELVIKSGTSVKHD
jgi:hypothetical protein